LRRDVATTLLARLFMLVGGVGASVVTARALGPTGRGDYAFAVTLAGTIVQLGNLGLHSSNTYLVAGRQALLRPLLANSLWVSIALGVGGGAAAAALLTGADLFPQTPSHAIWFVVALAPPALFFLLGVNLLVGIGRVQLFNAFEAGSSFVALIALSVAAATGAGVAGFLGASAAAWWLVGLGLLLALRRIAGGGLSFDKEALRAGTRFAAKAYLVGLLGYLVLRTNVFLLARLAGAKEVGLYSVAAQVTDVLALVPTSAAIVLFPDLVRRRDRSWEATVRMAWTVGIVLLGLCVVTAALARPFIEVAYGHGFEKSASLLLWMLPGVLAVGVITVFSQHVAAAGMPKQIVAIWGIGLVASVALGRLLIPEYGITGAGVAFSATYGIVLVLVVWFAVRIRHTGREAQRVEEEAPA
jgi:O-antigen/teichoic acid export membrane protein